MCQESFKNVPDLKGNLKYLQCASVAMLLRKILQILCYYVLPLSLFVMTFWLEGADQKGFFIAAGSISLLLILIILFSKPIAVITGLRPLIRIVGLRRELGVASFWFFLIHGAGLIYVNSIYSLSDYSGIGNYLFWGGVAAVGMILLGITSNTYSVKLLKRNWKRLHLIVYGVLFAAVMHAGLSEGDPYGAFIITGVFIVLKVLEKKNVRLKNLFRKKVSE